MSAYGTILAAIDGLDYVTVDTIRDATDAAQLSPQETRGALISAMNAGYLRPVKLPLGDGRVAFAHVPSTHEPAKGRWVMVYRRTGKPVPDHVCEVA